MGGKIIRITMQITIAIKKGHTPLKIVSKGTSFAIPFIMKTFIPTGGVMTPIATTKTIMTPNQMGSYPNVLMTTG